MSGARARSANDPDELLDLVDERERVIGTVSKGATECDPRLIHREIAVLVHRDGRLLWQLRSAAKTVMPLTWDVSCAGHVGAGEEPRAAAQRELAEELGVELELVALARRLVRRPNETYFAHVFTAAAPADLEPLADPTEVAALEWCDEAGYRRWRADGRRLSPVACELGEDFWGRGAARA